MVCRTSSPRLNSFNVPHVLMESSKFWRLGIVAHTLLKNSKVSLIILALATVRSSSRHHKCSCYILITIGHLCIRFVNFKVVLYLEIINSFVLKYDACLILIHMPCCALFIAYCSLDMILLLILYIKEILVYLIVCKMWTRSNISIMIFLNFYDIQIQYCKVVNSFALVGVAHWRVAFIF